MTYSPPPSGPPAALHQRFSGLRLVGHNAVAELYTGVEMTGQPVTVVVLRAHAGADPAVRGAFAEAVNQGSYSSDPGQLPIHAADLSAAQPWAASYQVPGRLGAERALDGLPGGGALETMNYQMPPAGPVSAPQGWPSAPAAAPGWPAPPPAPGWAPPADAPWSPQPAGGGSSRAGLIVAVAAVALVLLLGTAAVVVLALRDDDTGKVAAPVSPSPVVVTPGPGATSGVPAGPGGSGTPQPDSSEKPLLRQVNPVTVLGPSFATGDDTYTMAFRGWPFAFRTPGSWGCIAGEADQFPDAKIWRCVQERDPVPGQRVDLVLRECADGCPAARQEQMRKEWFDHPDKAVASGERTHYVEYPRNDKGLYAVDASHFFGSGDRQWHLGVYLAAPPENKDTVLKIFNDIVTQAG